MLTIKEHPDMVVTSRAARLKRALSPAWLGQTAASLCWMASVFSYGISSTGDWLQLFAASAWFLSNVSTLIAPATGGEPTTK